MKNILNNIDFESLRKQKQALIETIQDLERDGKTDAANHLGGILHLLDFIQDEAVETFGRSEVEVFGISNN